jgi:hypothetical protein
MYESGMDLRGVSPHRTDSRRLPAFCGLGICVDAVLFQAARLEKSLTRLSQPASPRPRLAPRKPWGMELLVTLGRQTRAG